ncbi:MAG: metallophosphoesterase family protein [bacterium]|nr:metallophosphoesterase family protein [bacterium]
MLTIVKGPYLQWPTPDGITIMWETSIPATSSVTFYRTQKPHSGLNGRYHTIEGSQKTIDQKNLTEIHAATLTGLDPETTYHYAVTSTAPDGESVESDVHPLQTSVRTDTPFAFAVTSETGGFGNDDFNRRIFQQIPRYRPDFLLIAGDSVSRGSRYEDWNRFLFTPGKDLFPHTPFYLCQGNHEENSPWYYRFTHFPDPGNYYSFDYGNTHFTALDSTAFVEYRDGRPVATDALKPGSPQFEFLVNDLKQSRATWKIVFFHYPPYVSGDYQVEEMRILSPVLEKHGVDLVFTSHTIVYERSHPLTANKLDTESGIIYIVAGGAGAKPDWFHHKKAWHTAHALAIPHFVHVAVAGNTLELQAIDLDGRLFDTLKLTK